MRVYRCISWKSNQQVRKELKHYFVCQLIQSQRVVLCSLFFIPVCPQKQATNVWVAKRFQSGMEIWWNYGCSVQQMGLGWVRGVACATRVLCHVLSSLPVFGTCIHTK